MRAPSVYIAVRRGFPFLFSLSFYHTYNSAAQSTVCRWEKVAQAGTRTKHASGA